MLDIFAGSNTTGLAAEIAQRRWMAFEQKSQYLAASIFRFLDKDMSDEQASALYTQVLTFQETRFVGQGRFEIEEIQDDEIIVAQPSLFEV